MANSHSIKYIASEDIFIAIILLDMLVVEQTWCDINLTPEAIARVAVVEAHLFTVPQSKL